MLRASEQEEREDAASARTEWSQKMLPQDASGFVLIDECGVKSNMTRLYGRSLRGKRAYGNVPHGHWNVRSIISCIRADGDTACMTADSPVDGVVFQTYVRDILIPSLRPGDIVIMDNLRVHKSPAVGQMIRKAGAEPVFLPPYSPDLNPIEKMWSKIKAFLRKVQAGTSDELHQAIADAFGTVSESDARGWFRSCGYRFI